MPALSPAEATDLFRREPDGFLDLGPGAGSAAHRVVGSGPDVLFVHGFPVSGATFRTLLPHLAEHVTCHVIDLPGAGSSRFDASTRITFEQHVANVRRVVDLLELDDVAVVGHDSGGMIARHALAGDERVRSWGLIDTEQPQGLHWRFRSFVVLGKGPDGVVGKVLGWVSGKPAIYRNKFVFGDAFADRSLLGGEFEELFLGPLHREPLKQLAAGKLLGSFSERYVTELGALHAKIDVPVQLVWGTEDVFFPIAWAREMVGTFTDAQLAEIAGAGLFSHEERPAEVAAALLPTLRGER